MSGPMDGIPRHAILDRWGRVVPVDDYLVWGAFFEDIDRRVVAVDHIAIDGGVDVSTVFLGLDHATSPGPPKWFETLVRGGPLDGEKWRYTTWAEAQAGHYRVVGLATVAKEQP